jgi:hypothetical protein
MVSYSTTMTDDNKYSNYCAQKLLPRSGPAILFEQEAEKVRHQRSRIVQTLNVEEAFLGSRKCWRGFSVRQDPL